LPVGWSHYCKNDQIRGLVRVGDEIYVGGLSGLKKVDWRNPQQPIEVSAPENFNLVRIEAMTVDASETIWIGHEGGLYARDAAGTWHDFSAKLPDPKVLSVCADQHGCLWVGTWRGVAKRDAAGAWTTFKTADGLPSERIRTIFNDSEGGIWFGTSTSPEGGLVRWFAEKKTFYSVADLLAHQHVTAMMEDRQGRIWIGTGFYDKGGVTVFPGWRVNDLGDKTILNQGTGLAGNKGRSLLQDSAGVIWVGSELDGLTRIASDGKKMIFTMADGLVGDEIMCMLEDPEGNLWLGQELGLTRIAASVLQSWP
jgi:ligand-binding sensor domain-containing protein